MSEASSPTKGLSGWFKNLKKNTSNDSVDAVSHTHHHLKITDVLSSNSSNQNLTRPPLNFKSRSYNSVRRPSTNDNQDLIRQQRDDFIASQKKLAGFGPNEIFGVPLAEAIKVAESTISVPSDDPSELISYGKIPLIIGKCGSFLKEKGLEVEGIFRIAGSSRRLKELQYIFSTPPDYGRKLNWEGYTVHDAASLFRRFLTTLPEPLVPLDLYEQFREPVKTRPRILHHVQQRNDTIDKRIRQIQEKKQRAARGEIVSGDDGEIDQDPNAPKRTEAQKAKDAKKIRKISRDIRHALKEYKVLIDQLPEAQRHLLFYLLDMLSMFAKSSKENLMTARNLAAIFQPSILSHPTHDLTPEEYALSQIVVEVLIEHLDKLLPDLDSKKPKKSRKSDVDCESLNQNSTTSLSKPGSTKNSSVNLLAVRNSFRGSRPHSRSLSSANGIPDDIKGTGNKQNSDEEVDVDDSSDDETYHDPIEIPKGSDRTDPINIPKIITTDSRTNSNISNISNSTPSIVRRVSESEDSLIAIPQRRVLSDSSRPRPVSMFPGALTHHMHLTTSHNSSVEEERSSRWLSKSPPSGSDDGKKGSWLSRLRSSSRNRGDD